MSQSSNVRRLEDNEAMAVVRNLRVSPQKLNEVARLIRGKPVSEALRALSFSRRRIAGDVKKVVYSAIANAEENHQLDIDSLHIKEAYVGKSLVMKRIKPRARGRASRILKPFSRLTVIVRESSETANSGDANKDKGDNE